MQFFLKLFVLFFCSTSSFGQVNLPTSYSFDSLILPNGWVTNNTSFYSVSGNTPPALKFDNSGDYLQIHFEESPEYLSYYLIGNMFSGGVFDIEESQNGNDWSLVKSFNTISTVYSFHQDTLQSNSKFIRFKYDQKITGNVGLDDVSISLLANLPYPKLRCSIENSFFKNGSEIFITGIEVGEEDILNVLIENIGNVDLLIDSIKIYGANSYEYFLLNQVNLVDSMSVDTLSIVFKPSENGSSYVLLKLYCNNSDDFEITLKGIGGSLASEPALSLSNLIFSNIKTYAFNVKFQSSEKTDGFIVLKSVIDSGLILEDGMKYEVGDYIGDWIVCSNDTSTFINPRSIIANTNYFFKVFSFNGVYSYLNYNNLDVLSGEVRTPLSMVSNTYYETIDMYHENFINDLTVLVSAHVSLPYSDYPLNMIYPFEMRDTSNNQFALTCVYSGEIVVFDMPFDWSDNGFSREHSYCHNWMPTNPANNPERLEYQDLHHLFPTRLNNVNSTRSNYPLGEVSQIVELYKDCSFGYNLSGQLVFEPRNQHKGDAARAIMYMVITYNSESKNWGLKESISSTIPYGQNQDLLKKWNLEDLPDNWEVARNDYIFSIQGNRNPFVDNPDYACLIDFITLEEIQYFDCSKLTIDEVKSDEVKLTIFPSPFDDYFEIKSDKRLVCLKLRNILGEELINKKLNSNKCNFNSEGFTKGVYFLEVQYGDASSEFKTIIKE